MYLNSRRVRLRPFARKSRIHTTLYITVLLREKKKSFLPHCQELVQDKTMVLDLVKQSFHNNGEAERRMTQ